MTKKYRLVTNFEGIVNEKVEGIGDAKVISYIQEFLDEIKKDPAALHDFFRFRVIEIYLLYNFKTAEEINDIDSEKKILIPVIRRLAPQASDYLIRLLSHDDSITEEENEMHLELFRGQIDVQDIKGITFEEVKEEIVSS